MGGGNSPAGLTDGVIALLSIHSLVSQASVSSDISLQPTLTLSVACRFGDVPVESTGVYLQALTLCHRH